MFKRHNFLSLEQSALGGRQGWELLVAVDSGVCSLKIENRPTGAPERLEQNLSVCDPLHLCVILYIDYLKKYLTDINETRQDDALW